jgi:hypothetical protein
VRGTLAGTRDLLERALQRVRVATGVDLALGQLGLRAQPASGVFSWWAASARKCF